MYLLFASTAPGCSFFSQRARQKPLRQNISTQCRPPQCALPVLPVLPALRVAVPALLAYLSGRPGIARRLPSWLRDVNPFILSTAFAQIPGPPALAAADTVLTAAPAGVALLLMARSNSTSPSSPPTSTSKPAVTGRVQPKPRRLRLAFAIGAAGSVLGGAVAAFLFSAVVGPATSASLAAAFCATYIGGTMNYLAVGRAVGLADDILAAGVASDLLLMTIYFSYLFWKGRSSEFSTNPPGNNLLLLNSQIADRSDTSDGVNRCVPLKERVVSILSPLALAFSLQVVCDWIVRRSVLARIPGISSLEVLLISAVAVTLSRSRKVAPYLSASGPLSRVALLVFFSALGSTTRLAVIVQAGPAVLLFGAVVLAVHALIMLAGAKWALNVPIRECLLASNANVGGPTTAAAYAASLGWSELVAPAVLVGSLGYAVATPIALGLYAFVKLMLPV